MPSESMLDSFSKKTSSINSVPIFPPAPGFLSIVIGTLSTAENVLEMVSIFPNPFNDKATLTFENDVKEKLALEIYDSKGQIIRIIQNIIGETVEINRDGLSQGLYFFRLFSTQKTKARGKLVVE